MSKTHSIVVGSNAPITVQLYEVDNDTGSNGILLTGATGLSAKAKASDGTVVSFTSAIIADAANGVVQLDYTVGSFTVIDTYDLQIQFTDSGSKVHIYPGEGNTLKLKVAERIT